MLTYLFHGPSGSGKDTQIDKLNEKFSDKFQSIGTGEMFRQLARFTDNPLAQEADKYVDRGEWVPDEIVYKLLVDWVKQYDQNKDWIFVSTVRRSTQIPLFDNVLDNCNRDLDAFVLFTVSKETIIERLSLRWYCPKCGDTYHEKYNPEEKKGYCDEDGEKLIHRDDDNPQSIKMRIQEYNDTITPIVEVYKKRGKFIEIDAEPSIEEINQNLIKKLAL